MPRGNAAPTSDHRVLRCTLVWLGVTVTVAAGVLVAGGEISAAWRSEWGGLTFDALLVRGTAVVGALAGAWIWLITTITVVEAAHGPERPVVALGPVRRLVLAACGVALASGALTVPAGAAPGHADRTDAPTSAPQRVLDGLPLPDRASIRGSAEPPAAPPGTAAPAQPVAHRPPARAGTVVVRAGDSLWSIAAATLPPGASDGQVDLRWREIYAANRTAVGTDPDAIRPGLRLAWPPA